MSSERPTLADVARVAGVHVSIVSKVLNNRAEVSVRPETRDRIQLAARKLNYRPNAYARGLRLSQTKTAGILVPTLRNPVLATIVRAASRQAWGRGYVVSLAEDAETANDHLAIDAFERLVMEGRIDGLLVLSARASSPLMHRFESYNVPTVFVNRRSPTGEHSVSMREEAAGRLAAEHLIELGHRHIGHIGPFSVDTAGRRQAGFIEACEEHGVRWSGREAPFTEVGGRTAIGDLLGAAPAPTAIFTSNINISIGAMAGARDAGISIPDELSLVGYDDDPIAGYLETPLTTIRMPLGDLGRRGVDLLLDEIEGRDVESIVIETPPSLVERESTAPPPG